MNHTENYRNHITTQSSKFWSPSKQTHSHSSNQSILRRLDKDDLSMDRDEEEGRTMYRIVQWYRSRSLWESEVWL